MKIPRLKIPVFVSAPSPNNLNGHQEKSAKTIFDLLNKHGMVWRALGRSDYPDELPLREVLRMVRHCSGGIILGFEQMQVTAATAKRGTNEQVEIKEPISLPTAWNHLEAGILFNQKIPILIFKEPKVEGGVFDKGVTDVFIHSMPSGTVSRQGLADLDAVFQKWAAKVRQHYYED